MGQSRIPVAVNQVECGLYFQNKRLRENMAKMGVKMMAYASLGSSGISLFCLFVLVDAFHKGRKVGIPFFRDLASHPGVGICNTIYQVKSELEQTGQFNPKTTIRTTIQYH